MTTSTAEALSTQAAQLPPAGREEVVERILDSLDQPAAALDALWTKEADDRLNAYRLSETKAVTLSEVIARYLAVAACASPPTA